MKVKCPKCSHVDEQKNFAQRTPCNCDCICPVCGFNITNDAIESGLELSVVYEKMEIEI